MHDNGTLTVSRLDLDHAGVYQCFIRNEAGETSKSTWLRVNSAPPTFVQRPVDITVIEKEDAKFQCETRGAPKPEVSWSRGNSLVHNLLYELHNESANNKDTNQPALLHCLISSIIVRCLESIIPLLAIAVISRP